MHRGPDLSAEESPTEACTENSPIQVGWTRLTLPREKGAAALAASAVPLETKRQLSSDLQACHGMYVPEPHRHITHKYTHTHTHYHHH